MFGLIKRFIKLIVAIVVLAIVAVVLAVIYIDSLAKAAIEIGGKHALGVETKVESVSIGLISGKASLEKLSMAEPEGFDAPHFLTLDRGAVEVSLASLRGDLVEIPRLALSGIDMHIETNDEGQANYDVIFGNQKKQEEQPRQDKAGKKFVIREIVLNEITVHVEKLGRTWTVSVPPIILEDIGTGGENGVHLAEVVNIILKTIWASVIANGEDILPEDLVNGMSKGLGGLKSLTDSGVTVSGEMADKITAVSKDAAAKAKDAAEKLREGLRGKLGGLLGGDKKDE